MKRAEFHETPLKGLNVTSCQIEGILTDLPLLRGLIVTSEQAAQLSALLGLVIQ